MTGRVDVHHHFLPEYYRDALRDAGLSPPDNMGETPDWSVGAALETCDRLGIGTAFLSISSPGVHFGDDAAARRLARRTNEDAARLAAAYPGRFGWFAITPLPDIGGALDEIRHAFDTLGADGIVFETNFQGTYLGDRELEPIYEELDRRAAVVFLHPTRPHCRCAAHAPVGARGRDLSFGYPVPLIEFLFETTRTVTHLLLSGTLARHPNIRLIVPHAGAALPVLAGRIQGQMHAGRPLDPQAPADIRAALRKLHYDLAGVPLPEQLEALLHVADRSRLHYGSDWPFTNADACEGLLRDLEATPLLGELDRRAAMRGNAELLFPDRLARGTPPT